MIKLEEAHTIIMIKRDQIKQVLILDQLLSIKNNSNNNNQLKFQQENCNKVNNKTEITLFPSSL